MIDLTKFDFIQYTPEEIENIKLLADFINRYQAKLLDVAEELSKITELINDKTTDIKTVKQCRARLTELEKENKANYEKLRNAQNKQQAIYEAAKQRYFNSLETEQDILADAQQVLDAVSKDDYLYYNHYVIRLKAFTEQSLEVIKQAGGADKLTDEDRQEIERLNAAAEPEPNYTGFKRFLIMCLDTQIEAYKAKGIEPTALYALIHNRAASDYPPTPEELTQPEPGEMLTEQQELDIIRTTRPENYLSINDAVSNALFNPERQTTALAQYGERGNGQLFFKGLDLITSKKGKGEVTSLLSVWYDDENISFTKNGKPVALTDYDRAVFNGIITLYLNGTTAFTLSMLYGAMTGKENREILLTEKTKGEIIKALKKLKTTEIELSFENEAKQYTFKDAEGNTLALHRFKETIINIGEADIVINGQKVRAFVISSKPKLLSYAQSKNQIINTPYKALELKISLKNTPEVIAIRQFIIDEIARIHSPRQSNHITYEAIYSRVRAVKGCSELTKKQKSSARESALMILNNFTASQYIKAYTEVKQGRSYHHIIITPAEPATGSATEG